MTTKSDNIPKFAGVDVGSLTTKSVIISNGSIAGYGLIPTGIDTEENGRLALRKALESANLKREDLKYIVATGYGRISAPYANKTVTEITCHARGAYYLHPTTRTIIDMGGQDCKAIRLDKDGNVVDFAMNDKCAAGTGRFLEVMANVFKVKLNDLGSLALRAKEIVPMSSTCTVFAESETVSLLARGEKPENILKGIHHAIANRVSGMFSRVGVESDVFFSGGVAKNIGMRSALEEVLKAKIVAPEYDPQLVGALGAAVLARNYSGKV
ncbi:MAG: BadF/BadG/BcrA/BcrD ATPase [Candidatus Methanoperedens nitroreducens]|uniref:BadF/BadG/BcrA/BcrD ATPase n=1 Tax=Candidatus Methanoperedens nitratireducens TaxID=1392998 RepID=A0A0N8KQR8_9EURY|nr:acyl-CoA dehydratase activase [Candidatus Methanoperedens sp. BLZ2]KAB2947118.1 MAG: 2-hydroxyglutaryl-CoA dehydratase [Candidatus Methanoperedens sp.]KPQ42898.1 MAG: BadF/BadG/BcrA/BcrD ATPase [Candidatus Methanoperedens sp. BLZ1]MBZ0174217.1 acyl-CoA dehydratase activase [Candidatus Methanoperedens nitroreducens]CAG0973580.1 2-hydroxyisocaproyl-CoA dehydratase activator [Methanosarcinales archaeon]MCX9077735.1 acyl-CoA dehydratase activase [Candidatus Methanoperedens sp.]